MRIETERLVITDFTPDMAQAVHLGSMDPDTQRFLPDEVFPTVEAAAEVIADLTACYSGTEGPFVHPFLLPGGVYAGYVQLVPLEEGWEVGYHTVAAHTRKGYATEALRAFLPEMMARFSLQEVAGVCDADNAASIRVLEKCGFRRVFEGNALYQGRMRPVVKLIYTP
ncbi:MAG: GNAT family N-acetyltransferase [Clostridia bacterium]|nr:GNAT family N-acetyltransferase [Clostridia bacterium]